MSTILFTRTYELVDCPHQGCNTVFGCDSAFIARRREDHAGFYCPNGHRMSFSADNETEKLRKELARSESRAQWQRDQRQAAERDAETQRRRAAAARGQLTKIKNRIAHGVCPVPGCKRSGFDDVARHIASVHPTYHAHEAQS
jgi:hypothetical protein